jgi:catechol 2,3-dioxygenase-like lactoylglutathione lyase family enzyme
MPRFDHVGVVVEDFDAVAEFFVSLGFQLERRMQLEGELIDKINGLEGVRSEIAMVRAPDGSGTLELIKYHRPADENGAQALPANRLGFRHICIEVEDLNGIVDRLRAEGLETVGEVQDYENIYRLVYVRGPEGLIVELAEKLTPARPNGSPGARPSATRAPEA